MVQAVFVLVAAQGRVNAGGLHCEHVFRLTGLKVQHAMNGHYGASCDDCMPC
jgi:hypothetical protein